MRTPRVVPGLNAAAAKAPQLRAQNDEVARILKGLKLDKRFFLDRIRPEALQELAPADPDFGGSACGAAPKLSRRVSVGAMKRQQRSQSRAKQDTKNKDFDIYLNEAVMPVLAQSLDALCRQLARMQEQDEQLDPKVRTRFNPLNWLGQQLIRRHPKSAKTPRRALVYKNFKDWADWEKGRRELLRKREQIEEVYSGFMLRGVVKRDYMCDVIEAIDETLHLEGHLKSNPEVQEALNASTVPRSSRVRSRVPGAAARTNLFEGDGWNFEEFWYHFASTVMKNEVVPYSLIRRGMETIRQKEQEAAEFERRQKAAEEERLREDEEKRRLTAEYMEVLDEIMANEEIQKILAGTTILSGDDVRPGDAGYEFESPPFGPHVVVLSRYLTLLGFDLSPPRWDSDAEFADFGVEKDNKLRPSAKRSKQMDTEVPSDAADLNEYWDEQHAQAWQVIQRINHAQMIDGVVDDAILKQALVPPVGFNMLRSKVEYEIERRRDGFADERDDLVPSHAIGPTKKETMEQLCVKLGMTMSRLEWLHKLFESFLEPDPDPNAPAPCCLYPECPASINKEQMRNLVAEVEPNLTRGQFEARFKRLDKDGSGLIEFDEFAHWVHSSDVRVVGNTSLKMTFEELAWRYQEPVDLIVYLYENFLDFLPEEVVDGYPKAPAGMPKEAAQNLILRLTPNYDKEDFDSCWRFLESTARQDGMVDFDEFLEILEFEDLPDELRDKFEEEDGLN